MKSLFAQWLIPKVSNWLLREPPMAPSALCDFNKIRFEIRPADVLLIEGQNKFSGIVKQITQSNWTHSVLYIGRLYDIDEVNLRAHIRKYYKGSPDEQLIVESLMGHGTIITPLSRYRNYHIRICRPRGLSREDAQHVTGFAINHLGMRYSLRHIFDLFRFLFPWGILPRRWRSSLFAHNASKPTEEICSSMIARAFQLIHFPIIPEAKQGDEGLTLVSRDPRLYTPKDFDYSPFFDIIKYPMTIPAFDVPYQDLPWENPSPNTTDTSANAHIATVEEPSVQKNLSDNAIDDDSPTQHDKH